jgi:uncharacterized membrane protein YfcA
VPPLEVIAGLLMIAGGVAAGVFGSLLGLGGGVLIVPILTLGFGLGLREAVGVSLVCVIVTSSASAGVYLQRHVANLRLGMVLELFTALGAMAGGLVAFLIDEDLLALLFSGLLIYVAASMARRRNPAPAQATADETAPSFPPEPAPEHVERLSGPGYTVRNIPAGAVGSVVAGVMSALLGVGGGTVKVPVMHLVMGVPLRVATATSNLMIGVTASASAVIYLVRGGIDPYVAGPTAIGVFLGASLGSRVAHRIRIGVLRWLFVVVLGYTAVQMLVRALG